MKLTQTGQNAIRKVIGPKFVREVNAHFDSIVEPFQLSEDEVDYLRTRLWIDFADTYYSRHYQNNVQLPTYIRLQNYWHAKYFRSLNSRLGRHMDRVRPSALATAWSTIRMESVDGCLERHDRILRVDKITG